MVAARIRRKECGHVGRLVQCRQALEHGEVGRAACVADRRRDGFERRPGAPHQDHLRTFSGEGPRRTAPMAPPAPYTTAVLPGKSILISRNTTTPLSVARRVGASRANRHQFDGTNRHPPHTRQHSGARGVDVLRERGVLVLQQGQHLHELQVERLAKLCEGGLCPWCNARSLCIRSSTWFLSESLVSTPMALVSLRRRSRALRSSGRGVAAGALVAAAVFDGADDAGGG